MKAKDVCLNAYYYARVSGRVVKVRIEGESPYGGWDATNVETRRRIRIRSAQRLRAPVPCPERCGRLSREARALADRADPNEGDTPLGPPPDLEARAHPLAVGTRVAFDIAQGLCVGEGTIAAVEEDEDEPGRFFYRLDDVKGAPGQNADAHRNEQGEFRACEFEVRPK
jgi:hypothetical protein